MTDTARPTGQSGMKTQRYGCKDKPGALVTVSVPLDVEYPSQISVRYPDEDYREYVFWWHDAPADSDHPDPGCLGGLGWACTCQPADSDQEGSGA